MGGLFHLFYFHHGQKGRKHKKKGRATLKPPQSNLELPGETLRSIRAAEEYKQDLPRRSYDLNDDASTEKSISTATSKQSKDRQNAPSIVARLMGMDLPPSDAKAEAPGKNERMQHTDIQVQPVEKASALHALKRSKSSSKKEQRSNKNGYLRYWGSVANVGKPVQPQVHPQEEELQKFKKEFEVWQAARFLECARVVELGNIPEQWLAQLDLTKEKMALYETSRKALVDKSVKSKAELLKSRSLHGGDLRKETVPLERKESHSFSTRSLHADFEPHSSTDSDLYSGRSSVPARIVVLKPGPDSFITNDESWISSCSMEDRDHIEDLLEEVKQRLKYETPVKTPRGSGVETPFKEKPAYIKHAHRSPSRQADDDPSESIRSRQSGILANELSAVSSPKFMSRATRKFLSERLENLWHAEDHQNIPDISHDISRMPIFDDARERLEKVRDILSGKAGRKKHWRDANYEADAQATSSRHELDDYGSLQEEASPRNLVRSVSAPLSGTSFGKLLLEDPFVSTGGYVKRNQEALESLSPDFRSRTKGRSDIREVSNGKQNLSLRKKLFNRKFQSVDLSQNNELDMKDIMSGPTILKSFNERNENSTEVPPRPVSICGSPRHEEFWRPAEYPSPISNSDVTSVGDQSVGNVFREISSNLTELRKQLNQLEYERSEITSLTEDHSEPDVVDLDTDVTQAEYEAENYIRDLLITSGLYHGSWEISFSRWDPHMKPLSNWVFEKVEESYRKPTNDTDEDPRSFDDQSLERKLMFDLLNETFSVILGPPRTLSKFRRQITDINILPLPQGQKLLEQMLEMISEYMCPSTDTDSYTFDDLMARDLNITPWSNLMDEEIRDLGKELENQITGELMDELVTDILQDRQCTDPENEFHGNKNGV